VKSGGFSGYFYGSDGLAPASAWEGKMKRAIGTLGLLLALLQADASLGASVVPAFPGALGWAAETPGGRGGKIIKVTSLAGSGPGSFREAIETQGPRIIVFEVGGVIDLSRQTVRHRRRTNRALTRNYINSRRHRRERARCRDPAYPRAAR
jgi:hypothetical protein